MVGGGLWGVVCGSAVSWFEVGWVGVGYGGRFWMDISLSNVVEGL